ncbi:hypothetical protein EVAR_30574_1 [Eumeta japonica]|uniref:Uncharacterized protein n=1 Tax=Eumeta variegata TaxID=151549 RepID=A0A4C1VRS9_EUMVA|nr:hypothetical protein EVAR_30574_1 [Eumeta japonica]
MCHVMAWTKGPWNSPFVQKLSILALTRRRRYGRSSDKKKDRYKFLNSTANPKSDVHVCVDHRQWRSPKSDERAPEGQQSRTRLGFEIAVDVL